MAAFIEIAALWYKKLGVFNFTTASIVAGRIIQTCVFIGWYIKTVDKQCIQLIFSIMYKDLDFISLYAAIYYETST